MSHSDSLLLDEVAPVLRSGEWVVIGHRSEIKLKGCKILHRCNGVIRRHGLDWLVSDKPLLNWILKIEKNNVDVAC